MARSGRCSDAGFENREQGRGCFFAWDGDVITHPEPERFFEVPIELPLPEDVNFIHEGASCAVQSCCAVVPQTFSS